MSKLPKLLVIDNYDSFTYNLVQMFRCYALDIAIYRSDAITLKQIADNKPDYILISPGPKDPIHAGISIQLIQHFYQHIPILGVCLGMQCINEAMGGITLRSPHPMHGKTSLITHQRQALFTDVPSPFRVARYHSLMSQPNGNALTITSMSEDNIIMGLSHIKYPLHGLQFHPESFLTEYGFQLIENFLHLGPITST
jgi:para-aminobenzoate synthetase component II